MYSFPFGKAAFSMLALALLSGFWLAAHPSPPKSATLAFWTFANTHYDAYKEAIPSFEAANPGVKVDLQLVAGSAVTTRLQAAFWADLDVPDLVEAEISAAGSFFRGPLKDVGFVDLTDRIHRSGL
jgi:arabinosaccharide transport system substrate-binding protein